MLYENSKISAQELKEVGRDELTGVNLGPVNPATLHSSDNENCWEAGKQLVRIFSFLAVT